MSGWIDPLGTRCLLRYITAEQKRLDVMAEEHGRIHPRSRRGARYRARYDELSRMMALVQALQRPGKELLPFKSLIASGDPNRRDNVTRLMR